MAAYIERCELWNRLANAQDKAEIFAIINDMPAVEDADWIPVKWRELTEEEQKEYADNDYKAMADFRIPEDGEEILICSKRGYVSAVVFCFDDYGIGDEQGNDWLEDVAAWRPMPKPYIGG